MATIGEVTPLRERSPFAAQDKATASAEKHVDPLRQTFTDRT